MKGAIAKGAAWMLLARFAERCIGLVSILVLARVLVPADFGLVAMAMSVIVFVELASTFGFDLALIQRENPTRAHYDTAWTLQVAFGLLCAAIIAIFAYPSAWFFNEPRLVAVMLVLALSRVVQSFENIGTVDFRRQMNFSREFSFSAQKKMIAFVVTVSLAVVYESYWALVIGSVTGRLAGLVLSYRMQPFRPRFSLAKRAELFSFSGWIFLVGLAGFASQRSSHFVVGRQLGSAPLGLYTVGSEIALLPVTDMIAPVSRAVFPGFARMASRPDGLRQGFIDVIRVMWILALPASFGVAAVAQPLVSTLLGNRWEGAIEVVQVLALAGALNAVTSNHYSAWLALGKTRVVFMMEALHFVVLLPSLLALIQTFGVVGAAYAELFATTISVTVECFVISRVLVLPRWTYLSGLWRPLVASLVMATAVALLVRELAMGVVLAPVLQLVIAIPVGAASYIGALALLWLMSGRPPGGESLLMERIVWFARRTQARESPAVAKSKNGET